MAAFGARPGAAAVLLPDLAPADAPLARWHRAVALGGQGRYAAARAELRELALPGRPPVIRSLALSTEGSLWRQLGGHERAAGYDGRAATLAAGLPAGHPGRAEALCDAWTGLAADALGTGRLALAWRLLSRVEALAPEAGWRAGVRLHWVRAETALAGGDGAAALGDARRAVELAEAGPSVRHRVKSALLLAAATAASGDPAGAARRAGLVAADCREHGLLPLRWATAMLLAGVGDAATARAASRESAACAARIADLGGEFRVADTR
ncbi:hypothetical protein ACWEQ0_14015 [Nocardia thailandica]